MTKSINFASYLIVFLSTLIGFFPSHSQNLQNYNVVWNSASKNALESMPVGGGDLGMNVWVEKGDLLIYLSRSGTFDELNSFPKLGRLRVKVLPNPFEESDVFRQELKLKEGYVEITGLKNGQKATVKIWADIQNPVAYVDVQTSKPSKVSVAYESWRFEDRILTKQETEVCRTYMDAPVKAIVKPDNVKFDKNGVLFYHHNTGETAFDLAVKQQGLESKKDEMWNPIANLAYGGILLGDNMVADQQTEGKYASTPYRGWQLKSKSATKKHAIKVVFHTEPVPHEQQWIDGVYKTVSKVSNDRLDAEKRALAWWSNYWERSYIYVNNDKINLADEKWQVGRNYQVFRYQLGCNAYGSYPTKFNGGLFTSDPEYINPGFTFTPDFRRWGGGSFTAQNQRLVYWPMLASGDLDMMKPQFDFYKNSLPNAELRSQHYWGHAGACFTEQMENFGLPVGFEYTWKRPSYFDAGVEYNAWIEYQWDTVFEFCMMILESNRYSNQNIKEYLPLIESSLRFYDEHYQYQSKRRTPNALDGNGKLVLYPSTALETYKMTTNPITTVTAMKTVATAFLSLPKDYISDASRKYVEGLAARIPDEIHYREQEGKKTFSPAKSWERINNMEFPQMYTVFPWRMHGIGRPDLDVAINTFWHGIDVPAQRGVTSWQQNAIFAALLGLRDEAAKLTIEKMKDSGRRFPTWWGPGHDWTPDHNWGGSGMIGLQEMILQHDGEKIYLGAGLPKDWTVQFKLYAPFNTIVEGVISKGNVEKLKVTPEHRAKDVIVMLE